MHEGPGSRFRCQLNEDPIDDQTQPDTKDGPEIEANWGKKYINNKRLLDKDVCNIYLKNYLIFCSKNNHKINRFQKKYLVMDCAFSYRNP